jgi:hypothetical protein
MGDDSSRLLGDGSNNNNKKKKQKTAMMVLDEFDNNNLQRNYIIAAVVAGAFSVSNKFVINGRRGNRLDAHYEQIVDKIANLKENSPELFTRMYRLSPSSFDQLLFIIQPTLEPIRKTGKNFVPPIIKLCLGLRVLAGGSYLDLSFGYNVPHNCVHFYAWQALLAIDSSTHPFIDNIKSPIYATSEELEEMEEGFAKLSQYNLSGTIAAGDGIVFKMIMPTNEEVDGDVTSYYTRKGYYAYGLQAFCDATCRFVMISSKLYSSTNDNTAYIVTQLSKDIKAGRLPSKYHVVMDEAYPCTEQEMSPWKGRNLPVHKDAFNYYLSLNRQVIERAFGLLVQRWGIFWRPLKLSMEHRGVAIRVACRLHNICISDIGCKRLRPISRLSVPGFSNDTDYSNMENTNQSIQLTDGVPIRSGYRSDLEVSTHRDMWTQQILDMGLQRPVYSKYSKAIIRP